MERALLRSEMPNICLPTRRIPKIGLVRVRVPPCDSASREVVVRRIGFIFQFYLTQFGAYFGFPSLSAVLAGKRT